jgi:hypothetical protein
MEAVQEWNMPAVALQALLLRKWLFSFEDMR